MENNTQQSQEIPQTPEIPQEQFPIQQKNKSPKSLITILVIASVLIAGYFVSAKYIFNWWPFSETVVETPIPTQTFDPFDPEEVLVAKSKNRDTRRAADINQLRFAIQLYFRDEGIYPMSLNDGLLPRYLTTIPKDPLNGKSYNYAVSSDQSNFHLWIELERKTFSITSDVDDDSSGFIGQPINASLPSTETCNTVELGDNDCIFDVSSGIIYDR